MVFKLSRKLEHIKTCFCIKILTDMPYLQFTKWHGKIKEKDTQKLQD